MEWVLRSSFAKNIINRPVAEEVDEEEARSNGNVVNVVSYMRNGEFVHSAKSAKREIKRR